MYTNPEIYENTTETQTNISHKISKNIICAQKFKHICDKNIKNIEKIWLTVFNFPHIFAEITFLLFFKIKNLTEVITNSRITIKITGKPVIKSKDKKQINTDITKILSANGSIICPNAVINFFLRAI